MVDDYYVSSDDEEYYDDEDDRQNLELLEYVENYDSLRPEVPTSKVAIQFFSFVIGDRDFVNIVSWDFYIFCEFLRFSEKISFLFLEFYRQPQKGFDSCLVAEIVAFFAAVFVSLLVKFLVIFGFRFRN